MGKFKSKKKYNYTIIYIGLFLISIAFTVKYLYKNKLIKEDTLIDVLISDNFVSYDEKITNVDFLLNYLLDVKLEKDQEVFEGNLESESLELPKEEIELLPLVYIYNTHPEEKYQSAYLGEFNIPSTVFIASKVLKEYLEDLGVGVIVEEESITEKLRSLGWKYGSSYKVSRMYLEEAYKQNNSLTYFIDLHRDSSNYNVTTTEINGEKYAKLLFVVGLDNEKYIDNLNLAENLVSKMRLINPNITRGIVKKSGKGVNGIYNQDFSSNSMLVEVGGQYNNIKEVNNTLKLFAEVLANYIKEDKNV